jgi:anti-sigma B factor antagonist
MKIEQAQVGPTTVVTVEGVIKMSVSGKQLSKHLQKVLEQSEGSVLVDLSAVDEVDSTGLGELVAYLQLFSKQGRSLAVVKPTDKIRRLLEFTNLSRVLPIYDNMDKAVDAVSRRWLVVPNAQKDHSRVKTSS